MNTTEVQFFQGKRPWSRIKDEVLRRYMVPYVAKIAKLRRPILLIDGFAGPGVFDDGSIGSPLIMVDAAESRATDGYIAIFMNRCREHHSKLEGALAGVVQRGSVFAIQGDSQSLLGRIHELLVDHSVFLYLDPFGLKGCEFDTIRPFLERDPRYSTEIVINMSVPTMHRLATRHAVREGRGGESRRESLNRRLSVVLGGEWWKEIMWTDAEPEWKVSHVLEQYRRQLQVYLPYSGSCPVREKQGAGLKYFVTFCSRHLHAMELMNDIMRNAYEGHLHEAWVKDTFFHNTHWTDWTPSDKRDILVLKQAEAMNGASRKEIWIDTVQRHFMTMTSSEFKDSVKRLCQEGKLQCVDTRGTGRLNDDSKLCIAATGTPHNG